MSEEPRSSHYNPFLATAMALRSRGPVAAALLLSAVPAVLLLLLGVPLWLVLGGAATPWILGLAALLLLVLPYTGFLGLYDAVEEAELTRKILLRQALHDDLTKLKNRSGLIQVGQVEMLRSRRMKRPLSLAKLDVDQFEKINSGYGREVGDRVLAELALLLHDSMREYDVTARFGDDEFVLLLPETDHKDAAHVVARYLKTIREHRFDVGDRKLMLTLSGGLATYSESRSPAESLSHLIGRAAAGLRKAKEKGGNRCCVGPTATAEIEGLPKPGDMQADHRSQVGGVATS